MRTKPLFITTVFSMVLALSVSSCKPDYETDFDRSLLEVAHKNLATVLFPTEGGEHSVEVTTNIPTAEWTATANADWCEISKADGKVLLKAPAYDGYKRRQALLTIAYGHQKYEVKIMQLGLQSDLEVVEDSGFFLRKGGMVATLPASATRINVPLLTNLKIDHVLIPDTCNWVHFDELQAMEKDKSGHTILQLKTDPNTSDTDRYCTVILQSSQNYDKTIQFLLKQSKVGYVVCPVYGNTEIKVEDGGDQLRIPFKHLVTEKNFTVSVSSDAQSWLQQTDGNGTVTGDEFYLNVSPNNVMTPRTGTVTVTNVEDNTKSFTIRIAQNAFKPVPPFNVENLQVIPGNGFIKLTWSKPAKVNYAKVVIECRNTTLGTSVTKEITDKDILSCTFNPTYEFAGDYTFHVKTYGLTGIETASPITVTGRSLAWSENVQVKLTASMITANATQPNDGGGIPALVDGKTSTYYHTLWESDSPGKKPHYIQIALHTPATHEFYFEYDGRETSYSGGDVSTVRIYGSNTNVDNDAAWTDLGTISFNMPASSGGHATAKNHIKTSVRYKYLRFVPTACRRGALSTESKDQAWWNMSNLFMYEVRDEAWAQDNM